MKGAAFGKPGDANLRGRLTARWADDSIVNHRPAETVRRLDREARMATMDSRAA